MKLRRGEVWWAELGEPCGSEPGHRRPVLVVQEDTFNKSRLATVAVVAITSEMRYATMPGNVVLPEEKSCLDRDSVVNVTQVVTIDRSWLNERTGRLSRTLMQQVDHGLRLFLGL